jgi:hypothetical protein
VSGDGKRSVLWTRVGQWISQFEPMKQAVGLAECHLLCWTHGLTTAHDPMVFHVACHGDATHGGALAQWLHSLTIYTIHRLGS